MMKRTHITIGIISAIAAIKYLNLEPITCILGTVLGSTTPDLDFKFNIKHRTITHSLLFLFISSLLFAIIGLDLSIAYFIGCAMHLIADSVTKMGIPFLYPFTKRKYGPKLIKTDGFTEKLILLVLIYFIFILLVKN